MTARFFCLMQKTHLRSVSIDLSRSEIVCSLILIITQGSICSNAVRVKREVKGWACEMNESFLGCTFGRGCVLLVCRAPTRVQFQSLSPNYLCSPERYFPLPTPPASPPPIPVLLSYFQIQ